MLVRMTEDGRRLGTARIATEVERPAFVSLLRGLGSEGEAGLGKECLDEGGPVLDALEPVLDDDGELVHVAGGEIAQAVLHGRPGALRSPPLASYLRPGHGPPRRDGPLVALRGPAHPGA